MSEIKLKRRTEDERDEYYVQKIVELEADNKRLFKQVQMWAKIADNEKKARQLAEKQNKAMREALDWIKANAELESLVKMKCEDCLAKLKEGE